jgi:hypothetical protein
MATYEPTTTRPPNRRENHYRMYRNLVSANVGQHYLDIRWRRPGEGGLRSQRSPVSEGWDILEELILRKYETYVGIAPRLRDASTRDAIGPSRLAWVDCDSPEATRRLREVLPPPTALIASGSPGRTHAYWWLDRALEANQIEWLNHALAVAVGADSGAVTACTAILRPAGSWNWKRGRPSPVEVLHYDPVQVLDARSLGRRAIAVADGRVPVLRQPRRRQLSLAADLLHQIPPEVYVSRILGLTPGRDHKVICPFHSESRPSLHVYDTPERGWCCYGCGRGGSIIDLAAAAWGLDSRRDFREIKRRLEEIFQPELSINHTPRRAQHDSHCLAI